jgi:hypothetical protein
LAFARSRAIAAHRKSRLAQQYQAIAPVPLRNGIAQPLRNRISRVNRRDTMPLTMTREVFITCAVTGSGATQDRSPHVPRTPEAIAASAIEAGDKKEEEKKKEKEKEKK